jgi:hypothetical protein
VGWHDARLYVTTPKLVYPGHAYEAEALVLNDTGKHVNVTVSLVDDNGRDVLGTTPSSAVAAPWEDSAVTVRFNLSQSFVGRVVRARATVIDSGRALWSETSAPILCIDFDVQPGYSALYCSIPARNLLSGKVGLKLVGNTESALTAVITPPAGTHPKFVDLLHNGELVRNFFASPPFECAVPRKQSTGAIIGQTAWGWYVARVITANHRVGYSDAVYVAPKGDLRVTESYAFDEGTGNEASDSSAYARSAALIDTAWRIPGANGKRACVSLNGTSSRINLPLAQAPNGPMTFTVVVRPHSYSGDGMIYCDSGGMWLSLAADGTVRFVRRGATGWITAAGHTQIPLDQWSTIMCWWDGALMTLDVNGKDDAKAACAPGFTSFRRALGCNPYATGSAFWNGDLSGFQMQILPAKK